MAEGLSGPAGRGGRIPARRRPKPERSLYWLHQRNIRCRGTAHPEGLHCAGVECRRGASVPGAASVKRALVEEIHAEDSVLVTRSHGGPLRTERPLDANDA